MLQGEIEKTGELVDVERPSPPKKRRRAKAEMPLEEELSRDAKAIMKKRKRPEGDRAAVPAGEEAKGVVSKKKRLKEQEGKAEGEKTKSPKGEAVVGEVRKLKRVKKAEKAAIPNEQSPELQATTDAPPSAAPPPAPEGTHASAQLSNFHGSNGITVFMLSLAGLLKEGR